VPATDDEPAVPEGQVGVPEGVRRVAAGGRPRARRLMSIASIKNCSFANPASKSAIAIE
jgi:hypothetical protein